MLSLQDCIALCELTEDEILAIAEHEHLPEIAALEMGAYLVHSPEGELCIKAMIRDDIVAADARGETARAAALKQILRDYVLNHPQCDERVRAALHLPERRRS